MTFATILERETRQEQQELQSIPSLVAALSGNVSQESYINFLIQAYHHVKHTVPILMAAGANLRPHQQQLLAAIVEYIAEEQGHEEWILNDIAACGRNADAVRHGEPGAECELLVAYIFDRVKRVNPLSVFGMVHVLEGTSIKIATEAADRIRSSLGLPLEAFSYLYSHGSLDQEHYAFFRKLMDTIHDPDDQRAILHTARRVFRLYGDVFRNLSWSPLVAVA